MNQTSQFLIYGADGYTGRLIAMRAVERGLKPTLAGRNHEAITALARQLDCPAVTFSLENTERVAEILQDYAAVMHCAGPFSQTAEPMMDACLFAHTSYLDITGEIDVILWAAERSERAARAGIALLPAVGFDVVPSDCLAAMLHERLPQARVLQLAFSGTGGLSPGTAKTMFESLPRGGRVRIDGQLRDVPTAWKTMEIPFRHKKLSGMTIPWGDVASAFYSTGIPNIEVYTAVSPKQVAQLRRIRFLLPLLGWWPFQAIAQRRIAKKVHGPSDDDRVNTGSSLWGRVSDDHGNSVSATLETLSGYELTAQTAVAALERVLARSVPHGFSTASQAFGKEFILEFPNTDVAWSQSGETAGSV